MKHDSLAYIHDIDDEITRIEKFLTGISEDVFYRDEKTHYAIARSFEIIGEASHQLSKEFKGKFPGIPWREISDTRNILIHVYSEINLKRIWDIIQKDLPILKTQINEILTNVGQD
ncbi:MAG: DUF86 domain-containing protein [Patescibacteria group bacterium]